MKKNLVKKSKLTKELASLRQSTFWLAKNRNFYINFGRYLDQRSCTAYLLFKRMLQLRLDKYSDKVKDSDNWDSIKEKEANKVLKKYFIVDESSNIEQIIDWLRQPDQMYILKYKTLKVKTIVISEREKIKRYGVVREVIRRMMYVHKDCYEVSKILAKEAEEKKKTVIKNGWHYTNQKVYNFPRKLKVLNRDVYCQPEYMTRIILKNYDDE